MPALTELANLIEGDIPEGRKHLVDSHTNLERVATYCEENYLRVSSTLSVREVDRLVDHVDSDNFKFIWSTVGVPLPVCLLVVYQCFPFYWHVRDI